MTGHVRVVKKGEVVKCLATEADDFISLVAFYSPLPFLSIAKQFGVIFIKGPWAGLYIFLMVSLKEME